MTVIDNLENSKEEAFYRMKELAGDRKDALTFIKVQGVWGGECAGTGRDLAGPMAAQVVCLHGCIAVRHVCSGLSPQPRGAMHPPLQGDLRDFATLDKIFAETKCVSGGGVVLAERWFPACPATCAPPCPPGERWAC